MGRTFIYGSVIIHAVDEDTIDGVIVLRFWQHYRQENCQWNTWSILRLDPQPHWGIDKAPCGVNLRGCRDIIGDLILCRSNGQSSQPYPLTPKWLFSSSSGNFSNWITNSSVTCAQGRSPGKAVVPSTVLFDHQPTLAAVTKPNDASVKTISSQPQPHRRNPELSSCPIPLFSSSVVANWNFQVDSNAGGCRHNKD